MRVYYYGSSLTMNGAGPPLSDPGIPGGGIPPNGGPAPGGGWEPGIGC